MAGIEISMERDAWKTTLDALTDSVLYHSEAQDRCRLRRDADGEFYHGSRIHALKIIIERLQKILAETA